MCPCMLNDGVYVRACVCVHVCVFLTFHMLKQGLLVLLLAYDLPSSSSVAASFLKRGVLG